MKERCPRPGNSSWKTWKPLPIRGGSAYPPRSSSPNPETKIKDKHLSKRPSVPTPCHYTCTLLSPDSQPTCPYTVCTRPGNVNPVFRGLLAHYADTNHFLSSTYEPRLHQGKTVLDSCHKASRWCSMVNPGRSNWNTLVRTKEDTR